MRVLVLAGALVLVGLAGCGEEAQPINEEEQAFDGIGVEATDTTGIIRGVVVDSAVVPIPGVTISVVSTGAATQSDEGGIFALGGLEPGTYFLAASKPGWLPVQISTAVEAGVQTPPIVKVQMVRDASTQPYVVPFAWDAYISQGFSLILFGTAGGDNVADYGEGELGRTPEFVQTELTWESTQPLGDWTIMVYSINKEGQSLPYNYQWSEGPSPGLAQANRTLLEENGVIEVNPLRVRVFNSGLPGTDPSRDHGDPKDGDNCWERPQMGGCMIGFGATIDQRFNAYTHAFFNWEPSLDWRFLTDGAPDVPPG